MTGELLVRIGQRRRGDGGAVAVAAVALGAVSIEAGYWRSAWWAVHRSHVYLSMRLGPRHRVRRWPAQPRAQGRAWREPAGAHHTHIHVARRAP